MESRGVTQLYRGQVEDRTQVPSRPFPDFDIGVPLVDPEVSRWEEISLDEGSEVIRRTDWSRYGTGNSSYTW